MKKLSIILFWVFLFHSCIPLKVAPKVPDYKTIKGKRFKKGLPKRTVFVFEDPKEAGEFYDYINTKYQLQDHYVDVEVPFQIENSTYYFSFYEVDINHTSLNLLPLLFDVGLNAALGNDDFDTYAATNNNSIRRKGNFYVAMEAFSKTEEDCLSQTYENRTRVLAYLHDLKEEYLSTYNYNEVVFKNE